MFRIEIIRHWGRSAYGLLIAFSFVFFSAQSFAEPTAAFRLGALVETPDSRDENFSVEELDEDNHERFEDHGFITGLYSDVRELAPPSPEEYSALMAQMGLDAGDRDRFLNESETLPPPSDFDLDEVDVTGAEITIIEDDLTAEGSGYEEVIPLEIGEVENYRMFKGARETELAARAMIRRLDRQLDEQGVAKKDYLVVLFVDAATISWEVEQLATVLKANGYDFKVIRFKSVATKKKKKKAIYTAEYFASKIFYSFSHERRWSNGLKMEGGYPQLVDQELREKVMFPKWSEVAGVPLNAKVAERAARSIAWNVMLQMRYFFRTHRGFQLSWFINDKTGFQRPWKEQVVEMIAATAIGSAVAYATKLSYAALQSTDPNILVQNAMIASFACEIFFGYFRKAQNALFSNWGIKYDHSAKKMVPHFMTSASAMFGLSMVVTLAPFLAGHRPIDPMHLIEVGLLHLAAKYYASMTLAKGQVGSEVTGGGKRKGWWSTAWNTVWAGFSKTLKLLENNKFTGVKNVNIMGQQIPVTEFLHAIYKGLAVHGGYKGLRSKLLGTQEEFPETWEATWEHVKKRARKSGKSLYDKYVWLMDGFNEWERTFRRWFGADEMSLYEPPPPPPEEGALGWLNPRPMPLSIRLLTIATAYLSPVG